MKLLIVSDAWYPQLNGVVRTYEHLKEEFEKMGHEVLVIGPADFPRKIPMPGYSEIQLAFLPYNRLKELIEDYEPDYIHVATEGPLGWAARKYCHKHQKSYTTAYHTQFPAYTAKRVARYLPFLYKPVHRLAVWIIRTFHSQSSAMFVATKSLEKELKDWDFKAPIAPLTRGVNLELFRPLKPREKSAYQDLKGPIALYVGRVAIEKNIEDFLSMDWEGSKVVIGDGPSREELVEKYPDAHFLGVKTGEELAHHYRSADVFVFPSKTDTFGIVLIEALASGLPIAGYPVTGPIDIVTEDFLGAIDEDLGTATQKAMENGKPKQRSTHVKAHYTWETMTKQFEQTMKKG